VNELYARYKTRGVVTGDPFRRPSFGIVIR